MMSVPIAYVGILIIWSTTPLAVKWSTLGSDFIFAITSRIVISALLLWLIMFLSGKKLPWDHSARRVYLASALGIYGAMMCVYWSSQYISSGVMSVLFGITPLTTGLLAAYFLKEKSLTISKSVGKLMGFAGLYVIFLYGAVLGKEVQYGVIAMFIGALLHSTSLVWIKKIDSNLPALSVTTGGLLVASIPYLLTWFALGASLPQNITTQGFVATGYLILIGSMLAFVMMFYVIKHVSASSVALIPLMTLVIGILLGQWLNNETITQQTMIGALLIMLGLVSYQWSYIRPVSGNVLKYIRGRVA